MVTVTELNRAPDGRFESLEADTITDGADVSHSGELADLVDVSSIQSSSDVTVTDTQPGTVADGEFLQNSGGNLTGGTVQTEPNVPGWVEDANSPINGSGQSSYTFTLNSTYDMVQIHLLEFNNPPTEDLEMLVNGVTTSSYNYVDSRGNLTNSGSSWPIGFMNAGFKAPIGRIQLSGDDPNNAEIYGTNQARSEAAGLFAQEMQNTDSSLPLTQFTFQSGSGGTFDMKARVYGVNF